MIFFYYLCMLVSVCVREPYIKRKLDREIILKILILKYLL